MRVIQFNKEFDLDKIVNFLSTASQEDDPASKNMEVENWREKKHTLLFSLLEENRFSYDRSEYFFLENEDEEYISGAGIYPADFDSNVAILQVRAYTLKEHRGSLVHGNYIIPAQIEFAKLHNYKTLLFTFNEYNLPLMKGVERISSSNGKLLGNKVPEAFKGWKSLGYPVNIKYTKQWCLYKHLEEDYHEQFVRTMADIRTN